MPRFVPRARKQRDRPKSPGANGGAVKDTNQLQILPVSVQQKEAKRQRQAEELRAQGSRPSSKKRKRLNKYIENKLRRDEASELLRKLSQTQVDTQRLQSSKHLGKRKRDQFSDKITAHRGLLCRRPLATEYSTDSDDSMSEYQSRSTSPPPLPNEQSRNSNQANNKLPRPVEQPSISHGSGLKAPPALGPDGLPLKASIEPRCISNHGSDASWSGFSDQDGHQLLEEEHFTSETGPLSIDGSEQLVRGIEQHNTEDEQESNSIDDGDDDITRTESSTASHSEMTEDDDPSVNEASVRQHKIKPRPSIFKAWAVQQVNNAAGHVPFQETSWKKGSEQRIKSGPIGTEASVDTSPAPRSSTVSGDPLEPKPRTYNVPIKRSADIERVREQLPVVAEEQQIMEAISDNQIVIICGSTGSGKTTQVPQFLYEAGYGSSESDTPGMVGVTQPRRVAAVSMARRVSQELGDHGNRVSYQIRFESSTSKETRIKFMTDGVLLREISQDFALLKYSAIVVDEVHERSVNTDLLIGMLSRIVELRCKMTAEKPHISPLKIVIMSATLRASDFLQRETLFRSRPPPLVQVEGRTFPVTNHFSRLTRRDYLEEAFLKVRRGHKKLPAGGILVFLTGQDEIRTLLRRLGNEFSCSSSSTSCTDSTRLQISASEAPLETDDLDFDATIKSVRPIETDGDSDENPGSDDKEDEFDVGGDDFQHSSAHILPLFSQLPTQEQLRVLQPPPEGSRLIVLATNVAETSLTIPGIRYVFDCGRSKERFYHPETGIQQFEVGWISKSSAEQRAGRAGRTGPGHCYRLYSSAMYERDFADHGEPEIVRTPISSLVLQLKAMGLENVHTFPFPTPPSRIALAEAENLLRNLGALNNVGQVSRLGESLSIYPVSPRYGKLLALGAQHGCLPYVIALVAGLVVGDVFLSENQLGLKFGSNEDGQDDGRREQRRKAYNQAQALFSKHDPTSDSIKLLSAICAAAYDERQEDFCRHMFLRVKALEEASRLRRQLTEIVRANHPQSLSPGPYAAQLPFPSRTQVQALNQLVAAGFIDQVAVRVDMSSGQEGGIYSGDLGSIKGQGRIRRAIDVPYACLLPQRQSEGEPSFVYIHPSSVLARRTPSELPQYVIYSHLQQSAPGHVAASSGSVQTSQQEQEERKTAMRPPKVRLHPLAPVTGPQLAALAHNTPLLSYGKPIGKIEEVADLGGSHASGIDPGVRQNAGSRGGRRRQCWVVPFLHASSSASLLASKDTLARNRGSEKTAAVGVGWPLPARKVIQRRDIHAGSDADGWVIERFLV